MQSQFALPALLVLAAPLLAGCGRRISQANPVRSTIASDGPDLSLHEVAFARTSEGRVAARGTAGRLDYRRAGGRLNAEIAAMTMVTQPASQLSSFGLMRFSAPRAEGEVSARRGTAWGGVRFESSRGDHGRTESVEYEGDLIHGEQPVTLQGPGYEMHGHGLLIRADGSKLALTNGVTGTLRQGDGR